MSLKDTKAFIVHLNDGTIFKTHLSSEVTLKKAQKIFVGQVISMYGDPACLNKPYPTCTKVTN